MKVNYKEELEKAARQMILIHDAALLNKLILRTIVKNISVKHAGIFLYDRKRNEFIATVSRGEKGLKIPSGFAKINKANPIVRYFIEKDKRIDSDSFLIYRRLLNFLRKNKLKKEKTQLFFYEELKFHLTLLHARACVAGFFREKLVGILFLGRKTNGKALRLEELKFLSALASNVVMAIQSAWLFEDLKTQADKNKTLLLNIVRALATAIEAKDKYTLGHTERVTFYSMVLFEQISATKKILHKERNAMREKLRIASLLHDIGKIGIAEEILNKNGLLNAEERIQVQKHPLLGVEIMRPIEEFKEISEGVKYHHERYDGLGYPNGLKGRKIPLIAAIISVADAYDAMTSQRPYRAALNRQEAMEEIIKQNKKQFHPLVVRAFVKLYKKGRL
ncbi:MAG: HD domain-containing protein [Candidatus Omnitrophica bacterium]|nr:HD domain-containing protein [Candidatus Omnitrophota bacterium]